MTELDVIIIGGGPAGLSAALWCCELGHSAMIFEKESELGGQLLYTYNPITNYLGVEALNGRDLYERFLHQIDNADIPRRCDDGVVTVDLGKKKVETATGEIYRGKAIVIATGVRRRTLGVAGEAEFANRGILASGVKEREKVRGKKVAIVGGGDAAVENAIDLAEIAEEVLLIHRSSEFRARTDLLERLRRSKKVTIIAPGTVAAIIGDEVLHSLEVEDPRSGIRSRLSVENVLIRIGVSPNTELLNGQVGLGEDGYVHVDAQCRTNVNGVYAVGDVASPNALTIGNATGQGTVAAKMISKEIAGR